VAFSGDRAPDAGLEHRRLEPAPGAIGLLDDHDGVFLSGDAIYDDEILDDLTGASIPAYLQTMDRLRQLDCRVIIGGHGPEMDRIRMVEIAEDYLRRRG
jgi:glyoxylase-like metal-dependent hydrolase (beta-lactamase superfamily II)